MKALVLGDYLYKEFFQNIGFDLTESLDDANLVVFTGGTDVSPSLYGESRHYLTSVSDTVRDEFEVSVFNRAMELKIPKFGICRGAQFLCVMSGGKLYQHVENHDMGHVMITRYMNLNVTSSHHQMMRIDDSVDADVLGWSKTRSDEYHSPRGLEEPPEKDLEVVYFRETDSLAHQPHPEWMDLHSPYVQYTIEQIDLLVNGEM